MIWYRFCGQAWILLFFIGTLSASPTSKRETDKCIKSCPKVKKDMLNVHLVCHTHDDLGWLKTLDEYYIGSKSYAARAGVQYIIESVVENLLIDPSRKFIYVETGFFWMWWREQNDEMRKIVKTLVQQGRLEFIGGGWSMNDEGAAHYNAIIDQMTWGFRRLKDIFGDCAIPKIGWQIDPFGHSREQASLFAQMGFDGLFVGRIDADDKRQRETNKTLELLWKPSPNLGKAADLFTGILYNLYQPPSGFCFDMLCNDEPIQDNPNLHDYNVNERVDDFLYEIDYHAESYATNNIMMTMGSDFHYQQAGMWYKNLDKLIKHVNERQVNGSKVNVFYSTPSCYLEALHQANRTWTSKTDDFFPYASDISKFWTGYFTSRPSQKGYVRQTNNFLQVCKQLDTLARLEPSEHVTKLREVMGVLQHHDAITGTSKEDVAHDYVQRLSEGNAACQIAVGDAYQKLMARTDNQPPRQEFCAYLNISICILTQTNESFTVTVYNPLAHSRTHPVRFPVSYNTSYIVLDPDGKEVQSQLVPVTETIIKAFHSSKYDLIFYAELTPLGYKTYFINKTDGPQQLPSTKETRKNVILSNEFLQVKIGTSGLLQSITNLENNITLPVQQKFLYYPSADGGIYVIRTDQFKIIDIGTNASIKVVKGDLLQEVHQNFSSWASQVIRLYKNSKQVEFEWLIGPIPDTDYSGSEVITRFETNLRSNGIFYTDSNGREIVKRKRNYRETWKVHLQDQPVAGNYYPVNSRIYLQDKEEDIQLTLLTDRSEGGSSMQDGHLELLVHRRIETADGGGTGEGVVERDANGEGLRVRGKLQVLVNSIANAAKSHREAAQSILLSPWLTFSKNQLSPEKWNNMFRSQFSGMNTSLPPNVHLLTLEQWKDQSVLIRLEHFYEKADDPKNMSQPVTVNLKKLFTPFQVASATEMALGANRLLSSVNRLQWKTVEKDTTEDKNNKPIRLTLDDYLNVHLAPMQIGTYIAKVKKNV